MKNKKFRDLEISEVVFVHYNIVDNDYQHDLSAMITNPITNRT